MSFINVDVQGEEALRRNFAVLAAQGVEQLGVVQTINDELEAVMRDSRPLVPVVTGTLRSSATVEPPVISGGIVSQACGYGGTARAYARKVHENPRAGQTGGFSPQGRRYYPRPGLPVPYSTVGEWKFLEKPFLARRARMLENIAEAIRKTTEALARG